MAKRNGFDDLDEMLVTQDTSADSADGDHSRKRTKVVSKKDAGKPPLQLEREAKARAEKARMIVICVLIFAVMIGALVAVGFAMGKRAGVGMTSRAPADPNRTSFVNNAAAPDMSPEGVKGMLKEAYFTTSGDLAVTFRLSNGTAFDHSLVTMNAIVFNDAGETVAEQMFEKFKPAVVVPAGGFEDAYVIVDKENVLLKDDPLYSLGSTLEITSKAIGGEKDAVESADPEAPKAIAPNRTYFDAPGNIPALSAEGVKATVIRAQYTNDGSLAVTLSLSNGTDADQQVSRVQLNIANGDGTTIASQSISSFDAPCVVKKQSYNQLQVIVDTSNVPVKDDPLSTLTCTVSVDTAPAA